MTSSGTISCVTKKKKKKEEEEEEERRRRKRTRPARPTMRPHDDEMIV